MIISIRPAQVSDAIRWEEIHASGWEYAYRGILDDSYLDASKEKFRTNNYFTESNNLIFPKTKDVFVYEYDVDIKR